MADASVLAPLLSGAELDALLDASPEDGGLDALALLLLPVSVFALLSDDELLVDGLLADEGVFVDDDEDEVLGAGVVTVRSVVVAVLVLSRWQAVAIVPRQAINTIVRMRRSNVISAP